MWCVSAPVLAFNHPEIEWRSVTSKHFVINFYDQTEPALYAAWRIAEEAYAELAPLYEYESERKIALTLADYEDYSNGWADWLSGAIMIWIPDARFELRGNTTWLRNVITHELAHIMSLAQRRKLQMLDWTLSLSYSSPSVGAALQHPFARMTFIPPWLAEGVAQLGAERMNGDRWDARRDMVLRCAVLNDRHLSLPEMSHFNHDGVGNEMVYDHGYSFASYIVQRMGEEAFYQMFVSAGSERFDFEEYFELKTGVSLERMYGQWLDSVETAAKQKTPESPTVVHSVWEKGSLNALPRVSPDGKHWGWLTNHRDDGYRTDLVIAKLGSSRPVNRIAYAQTAWCFSADGMKVYYVKARRTDRHGSTYNDLYVTDIDGGAERRLTHSARIYDVAAAPDGSGLVVTRYSEGAFGLFRCSLAGDNFAMLVEGRRGEPFVAPSFNPANASELVVARIVRGQSDIMRVDVTNGTVEPLLSSPRQEETPFWADDGRIYFNADYEGIHNIYSVASDGSDPRRHSQVAGGAFAPVRTPDGELLCAEYVSRGYRIGRFEPQKLEIPAIDSPQVAFQGLPEPKGEVKIRSVRYRPKLLRPFWQMETFLDVYVDEVDPAAERYHLGMAGMGLAMYRTDAIDKKWLTLGGYAALQGGIAYYEDTTDLGTDSAMSIRRRQWHETRFDKLRRDKQRSPEALLGSGRPTAAVTYQSYRTQGAFPFGGSDSTADDDEGGGSWFGPSMLLIPYAYYENASLSPTLGFVIQGAMPIGMGGSMPQYIMAQPFLQWHVVRDLYLGLSPYGEVWPAYGFSYYVSAPLWLQLLTYSYYEEDWHYTMRGITSLMVEIGPHVFPADSALGEGAAVEAMVGGLTFTTGIPIARSASFVIDASVSGVNANEPFVSALLGDSALSDIYGQGSLGTRMVFPIVKEINRGGKTYADALYGAVYYRGDVAANRTFAEEAHREDVEQILVDPDHTPHASVAHTVGAQLAMGTYKYYDFYRTLTLDVSYELLRGTIRVDAGYTF